MKWKTGDQLKIHLFHLLANEYEYVDDSFVVVLSRKRYKKINEQTTFTAIICWN